MSGQRILWLDENEEFSLKLAIYAKKHYKGRIELICMSEPAGEEEIEKANIVAATTFFAAETCKKKKTIIIHEGAIPEEYMKYQRVFRYNPADFILNSLLAETEEDRDGTVSVGGEKTRVTGVGGFAEEAMKLAVAYTLADVLAEEKETLLMDLSQFSGLRSAMTSNEDESAPDDIGELLYTEYIKAGYKEKEQKLERLIRKDKSFDYILPVRNPECLAECNGNQIADMVRFIENTGKYGYIVILNGFCMEGYKNLYGCFDEYLMVAGYAGETSAEESFMEYMMSEDTKSILRSKKTVLHRINLGEVGKVPSGQGNEPSSLIHSNIRGWLKEEFGKMIVEENL
ncbi:MAG: hypothetical protein K6E13_00710 [Lachnospiraceae bacterium]|nr:hypothetical protein [Lachnospiraceae bacterium]